MSRNIPSLKIQRGAINGSLFTVYRTEARPWNGHLLIFAHGCRPEGIALDSDLNLNDKLYQKLLNAGWLLAAPSYRREGIIVRDAVEDVINLHAYIVEEFGSPQFSLLEACTSQIAWSNHVIPERYLTKKHLGSMGGCIATHVSERMDCPFDGIMALGAALLAVDAVNPIHFSHSPQKPLLYITNSDETTLIEKYQAECAENKSGITPATWTGSLIHARFEVLTFHSAYICICELVYRIGHDNVSHLEREHGLEFLLAWSRAGVVEDESKRFSYDATCNVPITPASLYWDDEGAWGEVSYCDPWGDIHTPLTTIDMEKLGISDGKEFTIELGATRYIDRGFSVKVRRVSHFVNAKQGEWCAYDVAEGYVVISKNGYAAVHRACDEANVSPGSKFHILRPVGVGAQLMKIPGRLAARFFPENQKPSALSTGA